jgi:hypothetical protein
MIDLAVITAVLAHDRVGDQFARPAVTAAAPRARVRRAAVAGARRPSRSRPGPETIETPATV